MISDATTWTPSKPPDYDRRLSALNPNVRVVWNTGLRVWEIQELGAISKTWRYVMLYATIDPPRAPKYLPLPPPEEVMRRLHEIDVTRLGSTPAQQWAALCSEMDDTRKDWLARHFAEIDTAGKEYSADMYKLGRLGRKHFGPGEQRGKIRLETGSANMRKFMAERARR